MGVNPSDHSGGCAGVVGICYKLAREVGGGRLSRQPGQIRKEAAVTSSQAGRLPASHPITPGKTRATKIAGICRHFFVPLRTCFYLWAMIGA